jgi:peptidoglycan/xylan/chitin deacetylase (PgdA/CDA1 family)
MRQLSDWCREAIYRSLYLWTGQKGGVRAVLLYHSVGSSGPHSVGLESFKKQMELLRERFHVVRLCDLAETISRELPETNLGCVTFDDGWRDNYEIALPVLEQFGIKATFFIATGSLGGAFRTFAGRVATMTRDQVRELAKLGHEVGAHTVNHPKLTQVSRETASKEIGQSKAFLEELLGTRVASFAYPKGDCDQEVKQLVRQAGFAQAVTIREGLLDGESDWLALPRIWVGAKLSLKGFEARLSPATTVYRRLWKQRSLSV